MIKGKQFEGFEVAWIQVENLLLNLIDNPITLKAYFDF